MKYLVVFALFFVISTSWADVQEAKDKVKEAARKCQSDPKTAVDETALKTYIESKATQPAPTNFDAYALCTSKTLNWQNDDGSLNKEHIRARIAHHITDEAKVNALFDECTVPQENDVATAKNIFRCFFKHAH